MVEQQTIIVTVVQLIAGFMMFASFYIAYQSYRYQRKETVEQNNRIIELLSSIDKKLGDEKNPKP